MEMQIYSLTHFFGPRSRHHSLGLDSIIPRCIFWCWHAGCSVCCPRGEVRKRAFPRRDEPMRTTSIIRYRCCYSEVDVVLSIEYTGQHQWRAEGSWSGSECWSFEDERRAHMCTYQHHEQTHLADLIHYNETTACLLSTHAKLHTHRRNSVCMPVVVPSAYTSNAICHISSPSRSRACHSGAKTYLLEAVCCTYSLTKQAVSARRVDTFVRNSNTVCG